MSLLGRFLDVAAPLGGGLIIWFGAIVIPEITAQLVIVGAGFAVLALSAWRRFNTGRLK